MNGSDACAQIQSNPIESFTGPFPSQIKSRVLEAARREPQTTRYVEQTNNDRYSYFYFYIVFFYIFSSNRNTIPNDFFLLLCFYQIMIYLLIVTAIPILSSSLA